LCRTRQDSSHCFHEWCPGTTARDRQCKDKRSYRRMFPSERAACFAKPRLWIKSTSICHAAEHLLFQAHRDFVDKAVSSSMQASIRWSAMHRQPNRGSVRSERSNLTKSSQKITETRELTDNLSQLRYDIQATKARRPIAQEVLSSRVSLDEWRTKNCCDLRLLSERNEGCVIRTRNKKEWSKVR